MVWLELKQSSLAFVQQAAGQVDWRLAHWLWLIDRFGSPAGCLEAQCSTRQRAHLSVVIVKDALDFIFLTSSLIETGSEAKSKKTKFVTAGECLLRAVLRAVLARKRKRKKATNNQVLLPLSPIRACAEVVTMCFSCRLSKIFARSASPAAAVMVHSS